MAMFAYDPQPLISQEFALYLESENLLAPIVNNKRKFSTALLSSSPSLPRRNLAFEGIEIPANLRSQETYEFLGYDSPTAESLWERFLSQPVDMEADVLDFALWRVDLWHLPNATSGSDDWDGFMIGLGINDKLRNAIMLPEYADLRFTATCKF